MSELPVSAYPRCMVCGEHVLSARGALYEIRGFERARAQGGTNHVVARERTGRVVGDCCAGRVQRGEPVGQGALL